MKNKLKKNVPSCKIISQKEPGKEESKKPKKFLKKIICAKVSKIAMIKSIIAWMNIFRKILLIVLI